MVGRGAIYTHQSHTRGLLLSLQCCYLSWTPFLHPPPPPLPPPFKRQHTTRPRCDDGTIRSFVRSKKREMTRCDEEMHSTSFQMYSAVRDEGEGERGGIQSTRAVVERSSQPLSQRRRRRCRCVSVFAFQSMLLLRETEPTQLDLLLLLLLPVASVSDCCVYACVCVWRKKRARLQGGEVGVRRWRWQKLSPANALIFESSSSSSSSGTTELKDLTRDCTHTQEREQTPPTPTPDAPHPNPIERWTLIYYCCRPTVCVL